MVGWPEREPRVWLGGQRGNLGTRGGWPGGGWPEREPRVWLGGQRGNLGCGWVDREGT